MVLSKNLGTVLDTNSEMLSHNNSHETYTLSRLLFSTTYHWYIYQYVKQYVKHYYVSLQCIRFNRLEGDYIQNKKTVND